MKTMSELKYHYGLKMCIHPSTKQKQIIKMNSDVSRAVYNAMVAIDLRISTHAIYTCMGQTRDWYDKGFGIACCLCCMGQTKAFYNNNNQPKKATSDLGVA